MTFCKSTIYFKFPLFIDWSKNLHKTVSKLKKIGTHFHQYFKQRFAETLFKRNFWRFSFVLQIHKFLCCAGDCWCWCWALIICVNVDGYVLNNAAEKLSFLEIFDGFLGNSGCYAWADPSLRTNVMLLRLAKNTVGLTSPIHHLLRCFWKVWSGTGWTPPPTPHRFPLHLPLFKKKIPKFPPSRRVWVG